MWADSCLVFHLLRLTHFPSLHITAANCIAGDVPESCKEVSIELDGDGGYGNVLLNVLSEYYTNGNISRHDN